MQRLIYSIMLLAIAIFFAACGNNEGGPTDTPNSGTIDISVDETYKPVIEEQIHVFDCS